MLDPNTLILLDIDESTVEPEVFSYNEEEVSFMKRLNDKCSLQASLLILTG